MSIFTLAYRSIPAFSGSIANFIADVEQLVATSQFLNGECAITGALLFNEDWFVQLLEGKEADVRATLARIVADTRHSELEILFERCTRERRFPEWTMAFVGDALAIRKRFSASPFATPQVMLRGYEVVEFIVAIAGVELPNESRWSE